MCLNSCHTSQKEVYNLRLDERLGGVDDRWCRMRGQLGQTRDTSVLSVQHNARLASFRLGGLLLLLLLAHGASHIRGPRRGLLQQESHPCPRGRHFTRCAPVRFPFLLNVIVASLGRHEVSLSWIGCCNTVPGIMAPSYELALIAMRMDVVSLPLPYAAAAQCQRPSACCLGFRAGGSCFFANLPAHLAASSAIQPKLARLLAPTCQLVQKSGGVVRDVQSLGAKALPYRMKTQSGYQVEGVYVATGR